MQGQDAEGGNIYKQTFDDSTEAYFVAPKGEKGETGEVDLPISSDDVDDTEATNKFVTAAEKATWNAKQNALSVSQLAAVNSGIDSVKVGQIESNTENIEILFAEKQLYNAEIVDEIITDEFTINRLAENLDIMIDDLVYKCARFDVNGWYYASVIDNEISFVFIGRTTLLVDEYTVDLDYFMPISTPYGASLSLTINSSTYVVTAQLKDQNGNNLGTAQTIDLPLESVVVGGSYNSQTKKVVLTLKSGSTVEFSVADLVYGLQNEIKSENKLDADLVDDSNSTNKFIRESDLTNTTTDVDYIFGRN